MDWSGVSPSSSMTSTSRNGSESSSEAEESSFCSGYVQTVTGQGKHHSRPLRKGCQNVPMCLLTSRKNRNCCILKCIFSSKQSKNSMYKYTILNLHMYKIYINDSSIKMYNMYLNIWATQALAQ